MQKSRQLTYIYLFVGIVGSVLLRGPSELFLVLVSAPQLVYRKPWFVLYYRMMIISDILNGNSDDVPITLH